MLRIVTVDESHKLINNILSGQYGLRNLGGFTDGIEAVQFIQEFHPDLVICGIETVVVDGLEPVATFDPPPKFVLLVDEAQYNAIKNLGPGTIQYPILQRPVKKERLLALLSKFSRTKSSSVVEKIRSEHQNNDYNNWFLKFHSGFFRVDIENVKYFESTHGRVIAHLEGTEKDERDTLVSMKTLERELPETFFLRIHKSYIVNLKKITHLDSHEVYLSNQPLPIGRAYKQKLKKLILG